MELETGKQNWEKVVNVIQRSFSINKHVDFFKWLQGSVNEVLPHGVLLAAWGNFSTGELHYDVSSNVSDLRTQQLLDEPGIIGYFVSNFYQRWLSGGERWYVINRFDATGLHGQSPTPFAQSLQEMRSLLVFGVHDTRGKNDCIYVFFDKEEIFQVQHSVLGLLMPHLDAALRRVEYLEPAVTDDDLLANLDVGDLSAREQEILHWVTSGKTNYEIGMILSISPNTVKNHLKRIFQKMDVSCRAQAAAKFAPQKSVV